MTEQYKNISIEKIKNTLKFPRRSSMYQVNLVESFAAMVVPSDEWQYVCFDNVQYKSLLLIDEFVIKWLASKV